MDRFWSINPPLTQKGFPPSPLDSPQPPPPPAIPLLIAPLPSAIGLAPALSGGLLQLLRSPRSSYRILSVLRTEEEAPSQRNKGDRKSEPIPTAVSVPPVGSAAACRYIGRFAPVPLGLS